MGVKIVNLPAGSNLGPTDVLPVSQAGTTYKFSTSQIAAAAFSIGAGYTVLTTSAAGVANGQYIANGSGLVTITLPASPGAGKTLNVVGNGAGGWKIAQQTGGQINFGHVSTTVTTGYIASSNNTDCVQLVNISGNLWTINSSVGNLIYV